MPLAWAPLYLQIVRNWPSPIVFVEKLLARTKGYGYGAFTFGPRVLVKTPALPVLWTHFRPFWQSACGIKNTDGWEKLGYE